MEENKNETKKIKLIVLILLLIVIIGAISFCIWFFNRKFEITFDLNNGTKSDVVLVKYNKTIDDEDIKGKDKLCIGQRELQKNSLTKIPERKNFYALQGQALPDRFISEISET